MDKIKKYLKETSNKIIVSLITTGILAVLALIYANKNIYVAMVRNFIFIYWIPILLLVLIVGFIWLYIKLVRLENKNSLMSGGKNDFQEQFSKVLSSIKDSVNKSEIKISSLNSKVETIENDLLNIKREHLYQEARKHGELGQRGALICRLEVVKLDIKDGSDYHLSESLDELYTFVKKSNAFGTQDLSDAKNALGIITNDGHKVVVEEILSQIKSKLV